MSELEPLKYAMTFQLNLPECQALTHVDTGPCANLTLEQILLHLDSTLQEK